MLDNKSNWLAGLCSEIILMLENDKFNYTYSKDYNTLIVKLFRNYKNFIDSYNKQDEHPERFFDSYAQDEQLAFNIFIVLLKDSGEFIDIDLNNPNDIIFLESYFNTIALNLSNLAITAALQTYGSNYSYMASNSTHTNSSNKKTIKANEKLLNDLTLVSQQQKSIESQQNSLYQKDIEIKNRIVENHHRTINLLANQDLNIWKDQNNKLYYSQKSFEKEQKITKNEIADITVFHICIYDSANDVQVVDADYIIVSLLPTVRKNIFNPFYNNEFMHIGNNLFDRNTFEYTELLEKRLVYARINQLEQEISNLGTQLPYYQASYQQASNEIAKKENELENLRNSLVIKDESFIEDLLKLVFQNEDEFYFFMSWLSNFFWTLNKSNLAVVLIGDSETTDILVEYIIKPIFVRNKKYFSVIDNETLKLNDDDKLLSDKVFYHINNLASKTDTRRVSKLLRNIVKPNNITPNEAWNNDEPYIYGELLVTVAKESPCSYLKDVLSSCSVLRVRDIESILNKLDMDYSNFEKSMIGDIGNFTNKLVQYAQNNYPLTVLNTDEKNFLSSMKNGLLITPKIDKKIDGFVEDILNVNINAFRSIQLYDEDLHDELVYNFEEEMIAQPMLSKYFNIIHRQELIPDNNEFIKILQRKAKMYNEAPTDKSKYNSKKRYKISRD